MEIFVLSYANALCIYPKLCLQVSSAPWLRTYLTKQYVVLRYCSPNLCNLLMKVKVESEKVVLKLNIQKTKINIQKTKIMASGPINSWEIDGETVETVSDFILGGSKITADGDCNHEIKRRLLFERKVGTNLESILKGRDRKSVV